MDARRAILLASLAAAASVPLHAQDRARLELGGYGAWFQPDGTVSGSGGPGVGAQLVIPVWRRFGLDFDLGFHDAGGGVSATVPAAAVVFGALPGTAGPFLGAGYARPSFRQRGGTPISDDAVVALLGIRFALGSRTAIRVELRTLFSPATDIPGADAPAHGIAAIGFGYLVGGRHRGDQDADGVRDERDRCAGTPLGAIVDERGCPIDSDADGVPNGPDACPHTPSGARVTADGCPLDDDGDLVYDGIDQCPATPAGAGVDLRGCPADADGDGVPDGVDRCPNTPVGATVDAVGCPGDSDGDRVWDGLDRCPATPGGTPVGADGCPAAPPPIVIAFTPQQRSVELRGVNFVSARSRLLPESYEILDEVARILLAHPEWRIEVAGYTDNTGSAATNRRLSLARAAAVRAYLLQHGVPPDRLVARGYGPSDPVASNSTAEGRARNRRVELRQLE